MEPTTFLLIRHAEHELGRETLAGGLPGVHLSEQGRADAQELAVRLAQLPIRAVYSSPLERTRETAEPLLAKLNLELNIRDALTEVSFGSWAGQSLQQLRPDAHWRRWNAARTCTRTPAGELMIGVQTRAVRELHRIREAHPGECVAVFSHGDVIRAALAHALATPLDLFTRIEVDLASISIVVATDHGPRVVCMNHTGPLSVPATR